MVNTHTKDKRRGFTLVEMLPRILPVEDDEVGDALEKSFIKQGIR